MYVMEDLFSDPEVPRIAILEFLYCLESKISAITKESDTWNHPPDFGSVDDIDNKNQKTNNVICKL